MTRRRTPHHHAVPMDRRRFLLTTSGAVLGAAVLGTGLVACSSDDGGSDGSATTKAGDTTAGGLVAVGSAGLMTEADFEARVNGYLRFATAEVNTGSATNVAAHLIRAARESDYTWDPTAVTETTLAESFRRIDGWEDTRDFDLMYLFWLLKLGRGDTPSTTIPAALHDGIEKRLVANRYRYDDPLPADRVDNLWFWSENHRIIGLTLEFLSGQHLPTTTFTISGLTGTKQAARARGDILEWIDERVELGFFEWHSHVYMLKNITPLVMLAELADDDEIAAAAAVGLDLCFLDMAAHNHDGCYTAPRGRTYKKDKMSSLDEDTFNTAKFVFDDTDAQYQSNADGGATYLCAATRYRPPQALVDLAVTDDESVVKERHGVYFDGRSPVTANPKAPYGKDFDDPDNLPFWWSLGAVGMWPVIDIGVAEANKFRLWKTELFEQIDLMAALNGYDPAKITTWVQARAAVINFGFLSEANTYAYRNRHVSLASVLDHRFGEMRDQAHSWQAAIDENAMVFTNHPVTDPDRSTEWKEDGRPGYWTGEASMPRSAQHERTAVHIYQPAWDETTDPLVWGVFAYRPFTHAYVPQDHFDSVTQSGHWTIAARGDGHIALWSWRAPTWRVYDPAVYATRGMKKPFDLVAEGGADNVWIVEVGSTDDGDLAAFTAKVTATEPEVTRDDKGFTVAWTSPSAGAIGFSSTGAFTVKGEEQSLKDFPRHESPWGTVDHLAKRYSLQVEKSSWSIDGDGWKRTVS